MRGSGRYADVFLVKERSLIVLMMQFRNTLAGQVLTICLAIYPSVKNYVVLKKKGQANPSPIAGNIEQAEFLVLLGVTFQANGRFTEHIKRKPKLRKEGYNQVEIDNLFQSLVLPKISYGLPAGVTGVCSLRA